MLSQYSLEDEIVHEQVMCDAPRPKHILRRFGDSEHTLEPSCPCHPYVEASEYTDSGFIIIHNRYALIDPKLPDVLTQSNPE